MRAIETFGVGTACAVGLLFAMALPACVDDSSVTPADDIDDPAPPAGVAKVAVTIPDDVGGLHNAVLVVSEADASRANELVHGVTAILGTDRRARLDDNTRVAYRERTTEAAQAIATGATPANGMIAIVFEDSAVIGWRGPMMPAVPNTAPTQADANVQFGGTTFLDAIQTTNPSVVVPSRSFFCPAGAGAHGSLSTASTTSTMVGFFAGPFPNGAQLYSSVLLANFGTTTYNYPATFFGSHYHLRSQQTGPVGLTTIVFSNIDCYWFGL